MAELSSEGILVPDFVRRLGNRSVTVPSLNERKDDIPLFVERHLQGRKRDLRFLLALLMADWSTGEVHQLIEAINAAVSRRNEDDEVTATDLAGEVDAEVLAGVTRMSDRDVRREVLSRLVVSLKLQGFQAGGRGAGLQKRLADLLSVSEPTVSRWLAAVGLRDRKVGGE